MTKIRIGVIGYGYLGPNLVQNIAETAGVTITAVCDGRSDRLQLTRQRYTAVATTTYGAGVARESLI